MSRERAQSRQVEAFLRSGQVVCPYARTAALLLPEAPGAPSGPQRREIAKRAAKFVRKTTNIALVLVGPDIKDFAATRAWATNWFLQLAAGFAVLSGATPVEARLAAEGLMRRELVREPKRARPLLACLGEILHCICMAPLYVESDPRFAPVPILVVTRGSQVDRVPLVCRDAIRAQTNARKGDYDADELILPVGAPLPVDRALIRFTFGPEPASPFWIP